MPYLRPRSPVLRLADTVEALVRHPAPDADDAAQHALFLEGIDLAETVLDTQGEPGLAQARDTLLAALDNDAQRETAMVFLQDIAHTAAESGNPAGFGRVLQQDHDPQAVVTFGLAVAFFAKDPMALHRNPYGQFSAPEAADLWRRIALSFGEAGLLAEDAYSLLHPALHAPAQIAHAGLGAIRAFPTLMMEGLLAGKPVPALGHRADQPDGAFSLNPVQGRVLLGALVVQREESVFLDGDPDENEALASAYVKLTTIVESNLAQMFPEWNVGVMEPAPLFDATLHAAKAPAEYWLVHLVHRLLHDRPDLSAETLRPVVACVEDAQGKTWIQVGFAPPEEDCVLAGATLPLDGLAHILDTSSLLEIYADLAQAVLRSAAEDADEADREMLEDESASGDAARVSVEPCVEVPGVQPRMFNADGAELFFTPSGARALLQVSATSASVNRLH